MSLSRFFSFQLLFIARVTLAVFSFLLLCPFPSGVWAATWGDQGNGTYHNPILYADYSDPDVIEVNNEYFMTASDFFYMPGYPILKSRDMVNWTIIGHVYPSLTISDLYTDPTFPWAYGRGGWAPTLRYHDGKFYIYFCTPDEGLYMSTAVNPEGPWSPLTEVKRVSGWEDPTPLWDDDGNAYLLHSVLGGGPLILHRMSQDGKSLLDDGQTVVPADAAFPHQEGPKLYKRNGYYYIFAPAGGVSSGVQLVMRSTTITGPYQKKVVLEQGETSINGPHQGALVDDAEGRSWFYHFQEDGALGRVVHLQPVTWVDGWPLIGRDIDGNGVGEPVASSVKPVTLHQSVVTAPQSNDEFNSSILGLQWQWNHNPQPNFWSLTSRPGYLRLSAQDTQSNNLKFSSNTLTQKLMGKSGTATVRLDTSHMVHGQTAGIALFGEPYAWIGVVQSGNNQQVQTYFTNDWRGGSGSAVGQSVVNKQVYLRVSYNNQKATFSYSFDGNSFQRLGEEFSMYFGYWKGMKYALFSMQSQSSSGHADFDWFRVSYDGPQFTPVDITPTISSFPTGSVVPSLTATPSIAQSACPADFNQDQMVDISDYSLLVSYFFVQPLSRSDVDLDKNGIVDITDYSLFVRNFFHACPNS